MPHVTDNRGTPNHYPVEPVVYVAEYSNEQQRYRYAYQQLVAAMLIFSALMAVPVS